MSRITEEFETPGGSTLQKIEYEDQYGNEQQRWRTKANNEFRTKEQVESIKRNAARRQVETQNPKNNIEYTIGPSDESERRSAVRIRYPGFDDTEGLNPNKPDENTYNNRVRGMMDNQALRKSVENDDILRTTKEREKALEAKARNVLEALENARSRQEEIEILRQYDVY